MFPQLVCPTTGTFLRPENFVLILILSIGRRTKYKGRRIPDSRESIFYLRTVRYESIIDVSHTEIPRLTSVYSTVIPRLTSVYSTAIPRLTDDPANEFFG